MSKHPRHSQKVLPWMFLCPAAKPMEAKKRIRETARYIHKKFGKKARLDFRDEVEHVVKLLHDIPCIGPAEPYLADAPVLYRSIVVNHLNKMVYWINGDVIEIVDFGTVAVNRKNRPNK